MQQHEAAEWWRTPTARPDQADLATPTQRCRQDNVLSWQSQDSTFLAALDLNRTKKCQKCSDSLSNASVFTIRTFFNLSMTVPMHGEIFPELYAIKQWLYQSTSEIKYHWTIGTWDGWTGLLVFGQRRDRLFFLILGMARISHLYISHIVYDVECHSAHQVSAGSSYFPTYSISL